jgi:hypothetical protein
MCAVQKGMSALPPKADMCGAVRFGPIADIVGQGCMPSALSAQWVGSMVDRATVFDPILEGTEVVDFPIAHILKNLAA